jgi:ferric-dicitrate binding protein FerR (iron transport regulator)
MSGTAKESSGTAKESFHTLVTPRGGQYQLLLPDGSKVWLNAASSVRFPTSFSGKERHVELTGEAYFEIAKDASRPFRVDAPGGMQVEVLGTHFNIMSYTDENAINTTLLEGSVKVREGSVSSLLRPGEQASLNKASDGISVSNADVDETIAWKNGLFRFEGATIEAVMKQIARWYDVEVIYKGSVSKHFRGMISRSVDISQVIKMLELTSEVHFKIDGKTITVMP